jgi:hypothetical protein
LAVTFPKVFNPLPEVAGRASLALLQLVYLPVKVLYLIDRVHQTIMYLGRMRLDSS